MCDGVVVSCRTQVTVMCGVEFFASCLSNVDGVQDRCSGRCCYIATANALPTVNCRDRSKTSVQSMAASYPALSEDCIFLPVSPQYAWTN